MNNKVTDVVKNLIILNVIVYVCVYVLPSKDFLPDMKFYPPLLEDYFKPYQIVTHMFMHADLGHLFFNMLSLFFLGPYVERMMGTQRFLFFYLFCGFFALATHVGFQYYQLSQGVNTFGPVLGASGAVYGVLISFAVLFPNVKLMLLFPPIPIKARYLAIGLIVFSIFSQASGIQGNVAHLAHLGGAVAGGILTYLWYKR